MDNGAATSHLSPLLEVRLVHGGRGVFAARRIQAGTVIAVWGGTVVPEARFFELPEELQHISVQVEENLFLVPEREGPAEWVNHSCDPNAGMSGQIALVAMRDIHEGEEVCYDYAMSDGSRYDEFSCQCGSPHCRQRITGMDWRMPDLWQRYQGHFSPYLQRRIERVRAELAASEGHAAFHAKGAAA